MKASVMLEYYKQELEYLRDLGQEFSNNYPEIASKVGLDKRNSSDPYVDHLLESVAFLTARVQYKIDAAYPRLAAQLVETMFPQVGEPLPSSAVFHIQPVKLVKGDEKLATVAGGTAIVSAAKPPLPSCRFTILQSSSLQGAKVISVEPYDSNTLWPENLGMEYKKTMRTALKITLGAIEQQELLLNSPLRFFINMPPSGASLFFQQFWSKFPCVIVEVGAECYKLKSSDCLLDGFSTSMDKPDINEVFRSLDFESYRYGCDFFHFPGSFQFFSLNISDIKVGSEQAISIWFFSESDWLQTKEEFTKNKFKINCHLAINKFKRRLDRINLKPNKTRYPVYTERTNPTSHEVLSITNVEGYGFGNEWISKFVPVTTFNSQSCPMYEITREAYNDNKDYASETTQIYLKIASQQDTQNKIKQIAIEGVCSNRHWAELLQHSGKEIQWHIDSDINVSAIYPLVGPGRCYYPPIDDQAFWSLVQNIANQLTYLLGDDSLQSAKRVRNFLSVFIPKDGVRQKQLCDSIESIEHNEVVRKISCAGIPTVARGLHIDLHINDELYPHGETWLLGAVLERMLAYWVPVNSFVELSLYSKQFGFIITWPVRTGFGKLL